MSKTNNIIKKVINWKIILGIQVIASLALIGIIFKLGALPMQYALIVIAIVVLLCLATFFLMKPSKKAGKGKVRNIIGKLVSILLSVALLFGTLSIAQGTSVLDSITGANVQTQRYSVVVLEDSSYQKLSDLKNETVETVSTVDEENAKKAIEAMQKEESSIETKDFDSYSTVANDLYDGKTNAILVNESYYAIIEADHEDFQNETREIWSFDIEEEVKDISKNVNVTKEPFIVYISGIDTSGPVSTVSRSDVNMMVTVNPKTKQILLTSIPRDYYVTLANKGKKDKLTHSGLAGIDNTVATMENFLGLDINYYARVNFTSLIKMVDALGGITIDNDVAFTGYNGTYFAEGEIFINGDQALEYSRERHAFGAGDNERVLHQQIVIMGMLNKMMSPSVITHYSSVLSAIEGCFETNMSSSEITSLIQMQINDMSSWKMTQRQFEGHGVMQTGGAYMPSSKLYYMIPDDQSVSKNIADIKSILNGETLQ